MKSPHRNLYVEIARCLACRACEVACALEHSGSKELFKAIAEEPRPVARVRVEPVDGNGSGSGQIAVPLQCRHCEDAPCVTICPTDAMHKLGPEQPVLVDEEHCIGCRLCLFVCPFGVITFREGGKAALKCDLCLGRTSEGMEPACVAACKSRALQFLTVDEIARIKRLASVKAMATAESQLSHAGQGKRQS